MILKSGMMIIFLFVDQIFTQCLSYCKLKSKNALMAIKESVADFLGFLKRIYGF